MNSNKDKRIGEQNYNHQGELMTIVEYENNTNVIVLFNETNTVKSCRYIQFSSGSLKDNYYPSVERVGCIGNTTVKQSGKIKHSYVTWKNMLRRCYDEKYLKNNSTYIGCSVCKEWLCFENFEKWYNENYYEIEDEKMNLDKDILIKGNKVYSPNTCIFVPKRINVLFVTKTNYRGKYPIGVYIDKKVNKFAAMACVGLDEHGKKNKIYKGYYDNPADAFYTYKKIKEDSIKQVADEYKNKIPQKLYDAMYRYEVEITD